MYSIILFLFIGSSLFGQESRVIRGVVMTDNEVLIGASIFEYGNEDNYVMTNMEGIFEMNIPKREKVVLEVTYGCSAFLQVLYEVDKKEEFLTFDISYKTAKRRTKKILRRLKQRNHKTIKK